MRSGQKAKKVLMHAFPETITSPYTICLFPELNRYLLTRLQGMPYWCRDPPTVLCARSPCLQAG